MSDIPVDPLPVDEPVDQAFLDLIAKLGPVFNEVAKAAITEAIAATPTTTFRPGVVQGVSTTDRTASVLLDGDTSPVTAQILDDHPWLNARVMVEFVPPSAVFVAGIISSSPLPAGIIAPYGGPITVHADASTATPTSNQPPPGWLWCAGQAVSRTTYSALFTAIGTSHGTGDGATTFNVPDLRGRVVTGVDNMGGSDAGRIGTSNTLGTAAGTGTITTSHMPSHSHDLASHTHSFSATTSTDGSHNHGVAFTGNLGTNGGSSGNFAGSDRDYASSSDGSHSHSLSGTTGAAAGNTGNSGSGSEFLPPHMVLHFVIKA